MGEFKVHRVRFFDYMPSGIRCMAFNRKADRLALARLNGSVEIFNFSNNYFQEKVIPGSDSRSIEAICWVGCDRLFTAGLNGEVVEYDLERLCPKYTLDAFGGPIWTAACNSAETHFAFGCEDGSVKLFEILPDKIQFERNLDRQKGRILSLSWHKSGTLIAAGSLDVIRVFDVKSGHSVQRILVDRGPAGTRNKDCVVWNVAFLSDYTIVSGDSAGKVQLWDANKGTLIKTHLVSKWDVLSLSVSENEDSIVAGTSEGTVIQFQLLSPTIGDAETQWIRTRTFKHHTHDVRAVTETKTSVVSGGLDTQLVICPLMDKVEVKSSESVLRKVIFPHRSLVSCAKKPSLLLFQFPDQLELWRLGGTDTVGKPGESLPVTRKPEKLIQLKRKGDDHICCSTISECGHWIAYSTVSSIRLYQLQCDNNNISISKVSKLPKVLRSAHQLQFSADSSKLFVASEQATIHVISLSRSECKHVHTFKPKSGSSAPVHLLAASADGQWLTSANRHCEINVYNLKKLKHHCMVPVYNSLPSAMAIHPETNNLLMAHADQQVFEFSIVDKQYTDWSRKLQKEGLHRCRSKWHTPITHITFNPSAPSQVMLHDTHMFCIIDQSLPLVDLKAQFYSRLTPKDMSETDRPSKNNAFKMCKKYQRPAYRENSVRTFCSTKFDCIPLLHVNLLEDDWLVVVERPLIDIHSQLPAPVRQKKFGT